MRFGRGWLAVGSSVVVAVAACGGGQAAMPDPRPLVNRAGARLTVEDPEQFRGLYDTLQLQLQNIDLDPSFIMASEPDLRELWPWESLEIARANPDTVRIQFTRTSPDIRNLYEAYGHLHLMTRVDRLDEWLPSAVGLDGWELERAIVGRVADYWLMGRALFDLAPYPLLDQLMYARQDGQLDALLLALRGHEFPEARDAWIAENPNGPEAFEDWYRRTFEGDPPEIRRVD